MQFSPSSTHFLPHGPKHPQHPILEHPQSTLAICSAYSHVIITLSFTQVSKVYRGYVKAMIALYVGC